jgi:capsular exopolysaccharide synthesis family protein
MANDFQLTTNTAAAADFWTQGGQGGPGSQSVVPYVPAASGYTGNANHAPPRRSPAAKAHRLLRGRYPLAIFLAAAGAITGALAGWMALPPKYESTGLVAINTTVGNPGPNEQIVPMLTLFIQGQVGLLQSSNVAEAAVADKAFKDAWEKNYSTPVPSAADFMLAADVEHVKNGPLISVKFDDKKKEVAEAGCRALLAAYVRLHGSGDEFLDAQQKIDYNNRDLTTQEGALAFKRKELDALAEKYGTTDLQSRDQQAQTVLSNLEGQLTQSKIALENGLALQSGKVVNKVNPDPEYVYQQIAVVDPAMQLDLRLRENDLLTLEDLKVNFGQNHPKYIAAAAHYKESQERVAEYAKEYLTRHQGAIPYATPLDDQMAGQNVDILKQRVDSLTKMVEEQRLQANEIGSQRQQIEDVRAEIAQIQAHRDRDLHYLEDLHAQEILSRPVHVEDYGSEAELASDKRKLVAGLGFGFGGMIPIGLMLLYGMTENRFRYSDDASTADLAGVTLLGILPNLPDRLSDPQQAGIAAHCVHQIRTMLQISSATDEPQVIAVTSASSGDGKTSLTLALGLSYAAAGARTLLVDCDLVAAGLTHRLNVNSADGVLEAVANRALLEYVRTTDIADVAILPVGTTHAHHASTLSPVALRRLLSEGRKHFDIIIIDTGPILGSIEASLVCAAADRTILAVARNQQRPLVEKSIAHLQAIGANLAGVVFNRAHARDFERSMSGLALRSRPAAGAPGQASAAKAVAGSFKRAG